MMIEQKNCHGAAHNITSSHHHSVLAGNFNVAAAQQFNNARGRAGRQPGTLRNQIADIYGMEAVHIFFRSYRQEQLLCVNVRGQTISEMSK